MKLGVTGGEGERTDSSGRQRDDRFGVWISRPIAPHLSCVDRLRGPFLCRKIIRSWRTAIDTSRTEQNLSPRKSPGRVRHGRLRCASQSARISLSDVLPIQRSEQDFFQRSWDGPRAAPHLDRQREGEVCTRLHPSRGSSIALRDVCRRKARWKRALQASRGTSIALRDVGASQLPADGRARC